MLRKGILCVIVALFLIGTLAAVGFAGGKPYKILLAGYGWYYGIPEGQINNAELIALALDNAMIKARDAKGRVVALGKVHSIVIPVTWGGAWPPVLEAIEELDPDIVVGLGTSPGARGIRPEPWASNVMNGCDALPPDDPDRECKDKEPIEPDDLNWRGGNLPYTEMVVAMLEGGVPGYRGKKTGFTEDGLPTATPGWYLCNFLTWMLAKYVEEEAPDLLAGFIHVPTQPEYVAWDRYAALEALDPDSPEFNELIEERPSASMKLRDMIDGIRISLEECVRAKAE